MMKAEWAIVIGPFHSCEPNVEFLPDSAQRFLTPEAQRCADRGFNKTEITLICLIGVATREAQVQRLALALGVTAIMLCWGSVTRAQTAFYPVKLACQPLPSWYPRGWELMVRYPCYYVYAPSYYSPAYSPYPATYPHQRVSIRATHRVYRRPYLHPGWWW